MTAPDSKRRKVLAMAPAICIALTASACLALALRGTSFADSLMYRGGATLAGVYPEDIMTPLALQWRFTSNYFGHNPSSPAISGNTVFFSSGNRIYALDTASGALKWKYPQDQPMATVIRTSPAIANDTVFFGAEDGKLYAIDSERGKYVWAFDTRSNISSSPTIVEGIVYFGSGDGKVWAIDSKTGIPAPAFKTGFKSTDEISGAPAVANGFVYVLSLDQVLHAVGSATGKERWSFRLLGSVLNQTPVVSGEFLYIANGTNLTSLMGRTGTLRWNKILPSDVAAAPAITESAVFIVTTDNQIRSLDLRTGRDKWRTLPTLEYDVISAPIVAGRTLLVGTALGLLYAVDTETGGIKWSYTVPPSTTSTEQIAQHTNIAASPVVSDKSVYILSDDGSLASFRSDAADSVGPEVTDLEPEMSAVTNGAPPIHFEAKIVDEGSGVDPGSINLMIDGNGVAKRPQGRENEDKPGYKFDVLTSVLEYDTEQAATAGAVRNLVDGRHKVTITVSDWKGNTTTKVWGFTVDNSLVKVARKRTDTTAGRGLGGRGSMGRGLGGRGGLGGSMGGRGGLGGRGNRGGGGRRGNDR